MLSASRCYSTLGYPCYRENPDFLLPNPLVDCPLELHAPEESGDRADAGISSTAASLTPRKYSLCFEQLDNPRIYAVSIDVLVKVAFERLLAAVMPVFTVERNGRELQVPPRLLRKES